MQFIKKAKITTSDFWYDLFEGGYIRPEKLLQVKEDIKKVKEAIEVLKEFKNSADDKDIIEYS